MNILLNYRKESFYKGETLLRSIHSLLDSIISLLTMSSLFIAITGFLLPFFSFLLYEIRFDVGLLFASFLVTFVVYNLNKLTDTEEDSINLRDRVEFTEKNKHYIIFAVIASFFAAVCLSFLRNPSALFIILFPFLIGLVYSRKISNFRLKDVIGIKSIAVALAWAIIGTFLPLAVYPFSTGTYSHYFILIFLIFLFFFIKLFINTVLFDVRDIEGDRMSNVRTIPIFLGINKTKIFLLFLNSTLVLWLIFSYFQGFFHKYLFVLIFAVVYGYWYILHFCREGIKIGKSLDLLVDGEWIPIVILALIFA